MKKEEFLKLLYARLIERGVDKATAEKETSHVRTYLTESGMEDLNVSLDEMADGIISMIEAGKDKKTGEKRTAVPIVPKTHEKKSESVSDELGEAIEKIDDKPRRAPKTAEPKPAEKKPKEKHPKETAPKAPKEKKEEKKQDDEEERSLLYRMMAKVDKVIKRMQRSKVEKAAKKQKALNEKKKAENDDDILEYVPMSQKEKIQYDSNGKMRNEWLYVAILVVAIPIAVALILLAIVLYLGFWVALSLIMIACIGALVVFVTAGALVSIVGIVYGVVELITGNTPVGLFEIGLGIIVGAAVMFVGILIYNFAVRFIPFGMKLLAKLFKLGFRALRSGYNMLKGAVSEI
jgi:hypothetical protein